MNIEEFMKLDDTEKEKYVVRTEPLSNKDYYDFDIAVFTPCTDSFEIGMACEICLADNEKLIGTSDTLEPKFCFKHYAEINKESEFYKGVNYDTSR